MKTRFLPLIIVLLITATLKLSYAQTTFAVTIDLDNCAIGMERSGAPDIPAPAEPNFSSYTWTCGGILCIGRTLMSIDLSSLPSNINILDARLSLYADPACTYLGFFGKPTYGTYNRSTVRRITGPWDPNTVTWNNQPSTTKTHQVFLPSSHTSTQDYLHMDVTGLIQDMVDNPSSSYGIIVQMDDEVNYYKSLIFGSCLHQDESLRPKLVVSYELDGQKISKPTTLPAWEVEVTPNPASDNIFFGFTDFKEGEEIELSVYNLSGQLVHHQITPIANDVELNISQWNSGMYFFNAENKTTNKTYSGKFVRQ